MGVGRLSVLVFVDMAQILDVPRMAVRMMAVVMLVPMFVPFRAMDMLCACRPMKRMAKETTIRIAAIVWTGRIFSPRIRTDDPSPKKGAVEKNIWLRVAPSFAPRRCRGRC